MKRRKAKRSSPIKSLFPIDVTGDGNAIYEAIVTFLTHDVVTSYRENALDTEVRHLAVNIMCAFRAYEETGKPSDFVKELKK